MNKNVPFPKLPKREREVMEIVYALDRATVSDVQDQLLDQPTYAATRMLLQRLHKKGLLQAEREGNRYVFAATTAKSSAGRSALQHLIRTFFAGSKTDVVNALISDEEVTEDELDRLEVLISEARKRQPKKGSDSC